MFERIDGISDKNKMDMSVNMLQESGKEIYPKYIAWSRETMENIISKNRQKMWRKEGEIDSSIKDITIFNNRMI